MVLEKTPESLLDSKEIKLVNLKGTEPWILIGRTDAEAEAGHLMQTANSLEKSPMLENTEGRRRGHQKTRWLESITDAMDMNLGNLREMVRDRQAWRAAFHGVTESDMTGRLNNNNSCSGFLLFL